MSLLGVLNLGGSALEAQQLALQVTGNNMANAADPNYTREVANLSPTADTPTSSGVLVGTGVNVTSVQRQVDTALQGSLLNSNSQQSAATTLQNMSGQVQSVFNALSGNGLSDQLNTFFSDWSTLANDPTSSGQRDVVIQDAQNLSQTFNSLNTNMNDLTSSVQTEVGQGVTQVNQLAGEVASLNQQIVAAQAGTSQQANALLDQRDAALGQLSQLTNIQTVAQPSGSVNVYIGSEALVQGTTAQTLTASTVSNNGHLDSTVLFPDGSTATITGGSIGGLFQSQQLIDSTTDTVNSLASNLISSLNQLHASGQGLQGFTTVTGANAVSDPTQPLSNAGLPTAPTSGSFVIHLTDTTTGLSTSSLIPITETGSSSDTTLNSLAASLNGVSGVQASISNGQLNIQSTNPNVQISFSQDSSGVLSALGINTFFSGTNASNIAVNSQVASNPSLLAASANGSQDDNTTALAIANLNDTPLASLNGQSLSQSYGSLVQNIGSAASGATNNVAATTAVQQTLQAQQQSLSGVSTDQEALNMIIEQRTYEGAAQFISVVNNMLQTLLSIT